MQGSFDRAFKEEGAGVLLGNQSQIPAAIVVTTIQHPNLHQDIRTVTLSAFHIQFIEFPNRANRYPGARLCKDYMIPPPLPPRAIESIRFEGCASGIHTAGLDRTRLDLAQRAAIQWLSSQHDIDVVSMDSCFGNMVAFVTVWFRRRARADSANSSTEG